MNQDIYPIHEWKFYSKKPLIISGPCSAESFEQLSTISEQIAPYTNILRAGVWKPRSRPGNFEGRGEEALKWIKDIKYKINKPFAIEVAKPEHVEMALKYGIDVFWIGARTTVNPFNVQEICEALKGVDVPVLVKNPINPDLSLWIGAIERVYKSGVKHIAAIHRGFSSFEKSKYRNIPAWQLPLELKSKIKDIPLICDPSHIGGSREWINEISQKALDLNYDGLMIETHHDPDSALSDAEQQITPETLITLIEQLQIRQQSSNDILFINQLEQLRKKIDQIDREIVEAFAMRMSIVEKIGEYKKDNNVSVFQLERWDEILNSRVDWADKMNLSKYLIEQVYKMVHDESIKIQTDILNKLNDGIS